MGAIGRHKKCVITQLSTQEPPSNPESYLLSYAVIMLGFRSLTTQRKISSLFRAKYLSNVAFRDTYGAYINGKEFFPKGAGCVYACM